MWMALSEQAPGWLSSSTKYGPGEIRGYPVCMVNANNKYSYVILNDCNTLDMIASAFSDTINKRGHAAVGALHNTAIKTLLGSPNIGNYCSCEVIPIGRYNDKVYLHLVAFALSTTAKYADGYIYHNDKDYVWSGWKAPV